MLRYFYSAEVQHKNYFITNSYYITKGKAIRSKSMIVTKKGGAPRYKSTVVNKPCCWAETVMPGFNIFKSRIEKVWR
jgi:hypothetical protein